MDEILRGYADLFQIGTAVKYFPIQGAPECRECEIRSEPWRLGHGAVVVKVTGQAGCVSVDHLMKSTPSLNTKEGK